jgi:acyl-CoA reductase-like NAD-dependent aldehyde dehydrogenase
MQLDESRIQEIVEKVLNRLGPEASGQGAAPRPGPAPAPAAARRGSGRYGVFPDVASATAAAMDAFHQLQDLPLATRARMIEAIREVTRRNATDLSVRTVEETEMGRVEDKIGKNLLVANYTPGIEALQPVTWTGDHGLTLMERAPYGIIGSITPTTNATETIVCNAIGMIAGGNTVVFNTHPRAKKISNHLIAMLNQAMMAAGGPDNVLTVIGEPTIESANELMDHPDIRLLVVTGGPGVVDAAMKRKKKVIAAGPGNPPIVVDETAHIEDAARMIVMGASLDNNIPCVVEKEILAVKAIYDRLKTAMVRDAGAYLVKDALLPRLEKLVVDPKGGPNKDFVGKDASYILKHAGVDVRDDPRIILAEVDEKHPFVQEELLMPVIPLVRVHDVDAGIDMAKRVEHGFRHTAIMYSTNLDNLHRMARVMDCSIFVKNAPGGSGLGLDAEGYCSFTIASPTGEGLTYAPHFTRERRCVLKDYFRIV